MPLNARNNSGVTGVYYDERLKKYRSQINVLDKKVRLGSFQTFEEAVSARKSAELKYASMSFVEKAVLMYNPKIDLYTAKILFWSSAYEYYIVKEDHISCFKKYYCNFLKDYKHDNIENAKASLAKITVAWVGEDKKIMDDFIFGLSMQEIAKKYNFTRSPVNRKIVKNIARLRFN